MRLKKPFVIVDNKNPDEIKEIPTSKGIIRCYETDSFEVTNVCHHCGRFLSRDSEKKPDFLLQKHSVELWGIVKGIKWHTSHCKTHAHHLPYAPLKILIFPGFIITMVGIGLLFRVISTATQLT